MTSVRPFFAARVLSTFALCGLFTLSLSLLGPGVVSAQQPEAGERIDQSRAQPVRTGDRTELLRERHLGRGAALDTAAGELNKSGSLVVMRAAAGLSGTLGSTSIADFDGDGNQDLVIVGEAQNSPTATLHLGDGQGGFSEANAGLRGVGFLSSTSTADLDGDGNRDLLIVGDSLSSPTATLYLGDGEGGFSVTNADLDGVLGGSSSIADVDGDGNLDLLITGPEDATFDSPAATLYLGDGQGEFSEANAGLSGVNIGSSSSIADVDGDGNQDLLITGTEDPYQNPPTATLYLGDGQGGFSVANAGLTGVGGFGGSSTSIADVNGDENLDLLITGANASNSPTATLYLGDGNGNFTEAGAGLTGVALGSTSIADVDGDGNQDLLIAGFAQNGPTATLYLGDGEGGFEAADTGLTGVGDSSTSVADLYGDGDLDLLITGGAPLTSNASSARLYINPATQTPPNKAPQFAQTFSYDRPLAPGLTLRRTIEAGDLDGDSLSIQRASGPSSVSVNHPGYGVAEFNFSPTRNQGGSVASFSIEARDPDGATDTFSRSVDIPPVVAALSDNLVDVNGGSTSVADVDGDGNQDLLITGFSQDYQDGRTTTLYLGDGQGSFTEADADLKDTDGATSIADVNGDEHKDLLITGSDTSGTVTATLYLGDGQGEFTEANAGLTGVEFGSTSIADVNEDGHQDLLITGRNADYNPTTSLYLGDGQGGFSKTEAGMTDVDGPTSVADVNEDGHKDFLISGITASRTATSTLYLGDGQGGFSKANAGLTSIGDLGSHSMADVDEDGSLDLLITGGVGGNNPTATLYLGDGKGGFSKANAGLTEVFASASSIADFDGDGNQDLLITGADANNTLTATLYLGDGTGDFSEADAGLAGMNWGSASVADIDGDQDPDLLTTGEASTTRSRASILYENLFDNPLPVELAGVNATVDGDDVRLTWQTTSETGNARFEVQRRPVAESPRRDGSANWNTIGQVEGSGTTSEARSYQFTDDDLPYAADRLDYRLRQVDIDGSARLSKTVTVDRRVTEIELLGTFPNPASQQATVRYAVPGAQDVTLRLYDMLGRKVQTLVRGIRKGRHESTVDVSDLPSGTYFLRLNAQGEMQTRKLTIVR